MGTIASDTEETDIQTEKLRKQNLLNAVVKHSRTMTRPSIVMVFYARYKLRDVHTKKIVNACLIGGTIPMSVYRVGMENQKVSGLLKYEEYPGLNAYWQRKQYSQDKTFLDRIQSIHDDYFPARENRLKDLAILMGLTMPAN